jgi:hypothetical protein
MLCGTVPKFIFPELHSYEKNKRITAQGNVSNLSFHSLFHLSLSNEAFIQFNRLQHSVIDTVNMELKDSWSFIIWGSSISSQEKHINQ